MADPNTWREAGDPISDIRTFIEWSHEATWLSKIEVTRKTLDALRLATQAKSEWNPFGGAIGHPLASTPVIVVDDVPDGKARITWSSGVVQVIP